MALIRIDYEDGGAKVYRVDGSSMTEAENRLATQIIEGKGRHVVSEVWEADTTEPVALKTHWTRPADSRFDSTWELAWLIKDGFGFYPNDGLRFFSWQTMINFFDPKKR